MKARFRPRPALQSLAMVPAVFVNSQLAGCDGLASGTQDAIGGEF